jgi:hypothetical protein
MPATSESQARFFRMVLAFKRGHKLTGLNKGTMAKIKDAAGSMSEQQVKDFTQTKKG